MNPLWLFQEEQVIEQRDCMEGLVQKEYMPSLYDISRIIKRGNPSEELRHDYGDTSGHCYSTNSIDRTTQVALLQWLESIDRDDIGTDHSTAPALRG